MNSVPGQHFIFNLSGYILFLYAAAVAILYAVMAGNLRMIDGPPAAGDAKAGRAAGFIFLVALGSNFIGTAAIALLSEVSSIPSRHTMLFAPLLLLVERHIRLAVASPKDRRIHSFSLAGAAAGMLAGAFAFLGSDVAQKTFERVIIPGDVVTMEVADALKNPDGWTISIQLVVFYCIALAIFAAAHYCLKRMSKAKAAELRQGRRRETWTALASAIALNFMLVGAFILLGRSVGVQIRQAMLLLPMFVIMESYLKLMRADLANRRSHLVGLSGSALGLAGASLLFLRHAPVH